MQHPFQIPHQHQWTCMTSDAIQPNRFVVSWVDRSSVAVTKLPTTEHPRIGTAWNTPTFRGCGLGPLKEETFHCSAAFEMQWVVTEHNSNYLPATYQSKVLLRPQRIGHITLCQSIWFCRQMVMLFFSAPAYKIIPMFFQNTLILIIRC